MGVVWLAQDERLERNVALKFLPDEIGFDPEAEDEMKRETRRCLELTHANIIRIYDFVKDRQAAAISMEYIDGKTLAAVKLERPKRIFEVSDLRAWILQTCQALAYAHDEVGVIHRDLKPANLMVTSRGQIKIADFGIAQSVSDSMGRMTMRRGTSGTLSYMSPQQMNGERSAVTDDVYAMGATLYEFLTSKPPFYSGNISFQVRVMIPPRIGERRDELEIRGESVPADWEETIAACLSKSPEERPATMQELAERLGLIAVKPRVAAAEPNHWDRIRKSATEYTADLVRAIREEMPKVKARAFKSRKEMLLAASAVFLAVAGVVSWHLAEPFMAAPGKIRVSTIPPGAVIRISGRPALASPATIAGLRAGKYTLAIAAEGFDPVEKIVQVKAGGETNLGTIELKQAFGSWTITTIPSHLRYTLTAQNGAVVKEGISPDFMPSLAPGSYTFSVGSKGFVPCTETIQILPHAVKKENVDLISRSVGSGINDQAAKNFRGEAATNALNDQEKAELIGFCNRAYEEYLNSGYFARAAETLDRLAGLGIDVAASRLDLAQKTEAKVSAVEANIANLISNRRFASATAALENADGELPMDSLDKLRTRFDYALTPYDQQIESELKAIDGAQPLDQMAALQKFLAQYPDDHRLQLAGATVLTRLPPNHDAIAARLAGIRQLTEQEKSFAADPDLLKIRATLENELRELDALLKVLSDAKSGLESATDHISRLNSLKDAYEERRVGKPKANPFASTINFFGKVVTGHSVVDTEAVFSSHGEKDEAISKVQAEIDAAQQSLLPLQATVNEAQANYDKFAAAVPWN